MFSGVAATVYQISLDGNTREPGCDTATSSGRELVRL